MGSLLSSDADGLRRTSMVAELEEVLMSIVGGLDIHRKQLTYDWVDEQNGKWERGRITPADREHLASCAQDRRDQRPPWARPRPCAIPKLIVLRAPSPHPVRPAPSVGAQP